MKFHCTFPLIVKKRHDCTLSLCLPNHNTSSFALFQFWLLLLFFLLLYLFVVIIRRKITYKNAHFSPHYFIVMRILSWTDRNKRWKNWNCDAFFDFGICYFKNGLYLTKKKKKTISVFNLFSVFNQLAESKYFQHFNAHSTFDKMDKKRRKRKWEANDNMCADSKFTARHTICIRLLLSSMNLKINI